MNAEVIAEIYEALELMKKWRPLYLAVLKITGDPQQAREALIYIVKMEGVL